jgi:hypothetical protein
MSDENAMVEQAQSHCAQTEEEKHCRRGNMNTKLCEAKRGTLIPFGGMDWIILELEGNMTRLLAKESIGDMPFDENNSNNWTNSSLRAYLNGDFLETLVANGANPNAFLQDTYSLIADDGLDYYGSSVDCVGLLSVDQYRKHRRIISNLDDWWWLITSYSVESNGYPHSVRVVRSDGALHNIHAYNDNGGVRPTLTLKSDIFLLTKSELRKYIPILNYWKS